MLFHPANRAGMEKNLIERYFTQTAVLSRMRNGIVSPYLDTLADELEAQHYSRKSIRRQLRNAHAFGGWLANQQIPLAHIDEAILVRYTEPMRRCLRPSSTHWECPHNARGLPRFIALLRRQGPVPLQVQAVPGSISGAQYWLDAFDRHLDQVAGVSAGRRKICLLYARGLLRTAFGDNDPDFNELRAEHVSTFVQTRVAKRAPSPRRDPGVAVSVFLRFLSTAGVIPNHLPYAVPRVRQWRHAALPRFLATEDLKRVLALPTDTTAKGLRDRAMLLLLARLGLRAGEVVRLELEDVDWRAGNILIRAGKTRRERILPLPHDAGDALVHYLKDGRPASTHRRIFVGLCPPHEPLASSVVITGAAKAALRKAGVSSHRPGAYVFRHTIATHMVQRGTTFKEIADILGHRSLESTNVYAKLDLCSLAQVAIAWPGGVA
jgi:site-specific recombinase XerD